MVLYLETLVHFETVIGTKTVDMKLTTPFTYL